MGKLNKGGYLGGFDQLRAPNAPTLGTITAGNEELSVVITAPSYSTGTIEYYCATAIAGGASTGAESTSSPVTITGLTNGTEYTVSGVVKSEYGSSPSSATSAATPNIIARGLFAGGRNSAANVDHSTFIDSILIATAGNTSDFGDLVVSVFDGAGGIASSTRGIFHGGFGSSDRVNNMDYVTIDTAGNATDFGDLSDNKDRVAGCSSGTRGIVSGGNTDNTTFIDVIEFVTIANIGNVTDFGNLTGNKSDRSGNVASTTRGVFKGGQVNSSSTTDTIDFITIASQGNASDFGDATFASQGGGGCSNATQGIFFGGSTSNSNNAGGVNTIEKITIASQGNASDFGDLTGLPSDPQYNTVNMAGASSSTRGICASNSHSGSSEITFITFSSDGNSSTFGDFTNLRGETGGIGGLSNAHGGIA